MPPKHPLMALTLVGSFSTSFLLENVYPTLTILLVSLGMIRPTARARLCDLKKYSNRG